MGGPTLLLGADGTRARHSYQGEHVVPLKAGWILSELRAHTSTRLTRQDGLPAQGSLQPVDGLRQVRRAIGVHDLPSP